MVAEEIEEIVLTEEKEAGRMQKIEEVAKKTTEVEKAEDGWMRGLCGYVYCADIRILGRICQRNVLCVGRLGMCFERNDFVI